MEIVITGFSYFIEFFVALWFFLDFFIMKQKRLVSVLIGAGAYIVQFLLFVIIDNLYINILSFFLLNLIFALICFDSKPSGAIISSLFLTACMLSTEFLSMSVLSATQNGDIDTYKSNVLTYLIAVIFCKILYLFVVRLSTIFGLKVLAHKNIRYPAFLFLFPVCTLLILFVFWLTASTHTLDKHINYIIIAASIALVTSIIVSYIFYGRSLAKIDSLYAKQLEMEHIKNEKEYYGLLERQDEQLKGFLHDEKNHLSIIKSLADNPQVDAYIDSIYKNMQDFTSIGNTNNNILDLLLHKYKYLCEKRNIKIEILLQTADFAFMEETDLISFFSNILDNAIEAAEKTEERRISISTNSFNGFEILTCSNSCNTPPRKSSEGLLQTIKHDKGFHGYGIKNINRITEKYHGNFNWEYHPDSKEFVLYIEFNPKDEKRVLS